MICSQCKVEKAAIIAKSGAEMLPRGWKRDDEAAYCDKCWADRSMIRAVTLPVAEPLSGTWQEFREACAEMWRLTTAASNRMMTELYAGDVRRNGENKMPPMPKAYLYPAIRAEFPGLPSQSVASLERAVQSKYRAKRYEVNWTAGASLPTHRYPTPFPIPAQGWSLTFDAGDRPIVSARIGDKRWEFRLKGGDRFRHQIKGLRKIAAGAKTGEAALYKLSDGTVMCKLVAWMPRPKANALATGTLRVRTAAESLLVALNDKDQKMWTYNADHLRRWISEHRRKLQRWAEDSKFEQRPVPAFANRRAEAAEKQRNRMSSAVKMIAAELVGYAARRRFAEIVYDESEKGFAGEAFPYFALKLAISQKADAIGIKFASGEVIEKSEPVLAKGEVQ